MIKERVWIHPRNIHCTLVMALLAAANGNAIEALVTAPNVAGPIKAIAGNSQVSLKRTFRDTAGITRS